MRKNYLNLLTNGITISQEIWNILFHNLEANKNEFLSKFYLDGIPN